MRAREQGPVLAPLARACCEQHAATQLVESVEGTYRRNTASDMTVQYSSEAVVPEACKTIVCKQPARTCPPARNC